MVIWFPRHPGLSNQRVVRNNYLRKARGRWKNTRINIEFFFFLLLLNIFCLNLNMKCTRMLACLHVRVGGRIHSKIVLDDDYVLFSYVTASSEFKLNIITIHAREAQSRVAGAGSVLSSALLFFATIIPYLSGFLFFSPEFGYLPFFLTLLSSSSYKKNMKKLWIPMIWNY